MDGQPASHTHDGHPWVEPWGRYITVQWQDGPAGTYGENGAQVGDMIACCVSRLLELQQRQPCPENLATLTALADALEWQERRTAVRTAAGVEGTEGRLGALGWEEV